LDAVITNGLSFVDYENGFKLDQKCLGIEGFGGQQLLLGRLILKWILPIFYSMNHSIHAV
jgi:hypothetical protein